MVHLLAYEGKDYNQKGGFLGRIMHDSGKLMIRKLLKIVHGKYEPVIKYKHETGWIKDHVAAWEEAVDWVISLDEMPINKSMFNFTGPDDPNRLFFLRLKDLFCVMMDEDTHYDIRVLLVMKWVHEHWDRFERSAEQAYQLANFGNLYKDLLEFTKPLPLDDGIDENDIDYIAMERGALGDGLERDR